MDSMNLVILLHGSCNPILSQAKKTTKQRYYETYQGNLKKCPKDGANKPGISLLDKKNKEWSLVEGTICTLGTIAERTNYKQNKLKYVDLRLGIKNLYPGYKLARLTIELGPRNMGYFAEL